MIEQLVVFTAGIVLLLFSTRTLIKLSKLLSLSFKLSPLFIGITVIAIGTSLPELSVSSVASYKGDFNLAVGNIIGSNITNVLLVFAISILIGNLRVGTTKTPRNALVLLAITIAYTFFHYYQVISQQLLGVILICSSILLTFFEYQWALFGRKHEDNTQFKNISAIKFTAGKAIFLGMSIIGVITGGFLIVKSVEDLSVITGLSTGILGLTLTAVATSLPELLTSIFSQQNHDEKMTIGNVIGSNIYNLLLIGGTISLFGNENGLPEINWATLNIVTIFFVSLIFIYKGKTIPKWIGAASLLAYILYIFLETEKLPVNL